MKEIISITLLVLTVIFNIYYNHNIIGYFVAYQEETYYVAKAVFSVLNVFFAMQILRGKNYGLYGLFTLTLILLTINLHVTVPLEKAIMPMIMFILYLFSQKMTFKKVFLAIVLSSIVVAESLRDISCG